MVPLKCPYCMTCMGVGRPLFLNNVHTHHPLKEKHDFVYKKNLAFTALVKYTLYLLSHHMPSQGSGQLSSTLSLYSPKVPRLTLRCRVYLALPAEQAAEGKQAQ